MTDHQIIEIAKQFETIQVMNYYIAALLVLVTVLFSAVIHYFKKDAEETKKSLIQNGLMSTKNQQTIDLALIEIKHNREQTQQMLRILAEHTGANIGL